MTIKGGLPRETFQIPLLGEEEAPRNEIKISLDEIGYSGFLTVEFESLIITSKSYRAIRDWLQDRRWTM